MNNPYLKYTTNDKSVAPNTVSVSPPVRSKSTSSKSQTPLPTENTTTPNSNGLGIIDFDGNISSSSSSSYCHTLNYFEVSAGDKLFQVVFEGTLRQLLSKIRNSELGLLGKEIFINKDMINYIKISSTNNSIEEQSKEYQDYLSAINQGEFPITLITDTSRTPMPEEHYANADESDIY